MVNIPAICNSCGTLFAAPNLIGGNGQVSFHDCLLSPCPNCGGSGNIIDGVYDAATNTAHFLVSSISSKEQLSKLQALLIAAQKRKFSNEQLAKKVKEEVPELKSFSDWLPKTRTELYAFVGIIIALVTFLLSTASGFFESDDSISKEDVQRLIDEAVENLPKQQTPQIIPKKKKIGRNEPCPCGSGKKYKKCCLQSA